MKPIFLKYDKCGTCRKAQKWLKDNDIEVEAREIIEQNPSAQEIPQWSKLSGTPLRKFFNTSGLRYKELGLKDIIPNATDEELIQLLASEGRLIKRPILVTKDNVLVGFNESEWQSLLEQ